ncbi:MAG TPA: SDR family NAD(P)-dependent oxidoreductase [Acidimicrobiia bacterium]|nr:SDR family NAD(P)-dependent oxidoreductase [Acidimicrobiia bacterium]
MRNAIVTGGGNGIGAVIARAAAARGYRVGVLDRDAEGAVRVAEGLPNAVPLVADVTDESTVEAAFDALGAPPDLVVNNAGVVAFGPLLELSLRDWRDVVDVNLSGTFVVARAAARRMRAAGGGSIVNMTSINGVAPGPNAGAYGATKAAVALLTQQMAIEWGPLGIRVNAVAPGLILAGMSEPIYADDEFRARRESKVPLGRLGTAEEVADVVLFLASPEAQYVTGQNVVVDGGVTMNMIGQLPRPASVDSVGAAD